MHSGLGDCERVSRLAPGPESQEEQVYSVGEGPRRPEPGEEQRVLPPREVKSNRWGQACGKFFLAVKLSSLALVTSKQLPQDGKEGNEAVAQRDSSVPPKAERSEAPSQPV